MVEAKLNRDPEQHNETDSDKDAKIISYLVDVLLLRKKVPFPSDEPSPQKQTLEQWSLVGRAMLGSHPGDE